VRTEKWTLNIIVTCIQNVRRTFVRIKTAMTPLQPLLLRRLKTFSLHFRNYRWRGETHYDVLGVPDDASPVQIKNAYLSLSKELHPDKNQTKDEKEAFAAHQKFVRVTQAYSVLGNKQQRNLYDREVLMKMREEMGEQQSGSSGNINEKMRPMTFEERARAMGFNKKQDPDFYKKHGNYHRKVLVFCLLWILAGVLVQGAAVMGLYNRHISVLDMETKKNNEILMSARASSTQYGSLVEQREAMSKRWAEEVTLKKA
jgi:DnaJ-domain-containing protein 1